MGLGIWIVGERGFLNEKVFRGTGSVFVGIEKLGGMFAEALWLRLVFAEGFGPGGAFVGMEGFLDRHSSPALLFVRFAKRAERSEAKRAEHSIGGKKCQGALCEASEASKRSEAS